MKVGFIGLGIMGTQMATQLMENGIDVTLYNRSPEKYQNFQSYELNEKT